MRYTNAEIDYMTQCFHKGGTWCEIADQMNSMFNTARTMQGIKQMAHKIGLFHEYHEAYTDEQNEWIKKHVAEYENYATMARDFNKVFRTNKADRGLQSHAVRCLGIVSGRQAFKRGIKVHNKRPIGSVYYNTANGYTFVKVSDTGIKNKDWEAKQRVIWSEKYGEIPKGYNVIFIDGDKSNYDIDNLACISNRINRILESRRWHFKNKDLLMCAIKEIELEENVKQ